MIYKIPIYIEINVEGDFAPVTLNEAVDQVISKRISSTIFEKGGFPLDSKNDMFDTTANEVKKRLGAKRVTVKLLQKSQVLQKISDRE